MGGAGSRTRGGLGGGGQSGWVGRDGTGLDGGMARRRQEQQQQQQQQPKKASGHKHSTLLTQIPDKDAAPLPPTATSSAAASSSAGGGELAPARGRVRPELEASSSSVSGVRGASHGGGWLG